MHAREPVDWKVLQLTKEKITLKMYSFSRSQFTYLKMPAPQVMDEYWQNVYWVPGAGFCIFADWYFKSYKPKLILAQALIPSL